MALKPSERRKMDESSPKRLTPEQEAEELEKKYKNKKLSLFEKLSRKKITYEEELTVYKDQNPIFLSKRDVYVNRAIQESLIRWLFYLLIIVNLLIGANIAINFFKREPDFYTVEQNAKILCADVYINKNGTLIKKETPERVAFCEELRKEGGFK